MFKKIVLKDLSDKKLEKLHLPRQDEIKLWNVLRERIPNEKLKNSKAQKIEYNENNYVLLNLANKKNFLIGTKLGSGNFGTVFVAIDIESKELRALKFTQTLMRCTLGPLLIGVIGDIFSLCSPIETWALENFSNTSEITQISSEELKNIAAEYGEIEGAIYVIDAPYLPGKTFDNYFQTPTTINRQERFSEINFNEKKKHFSTIELLLLARNFLLEIQKYLKRDYLIIDLQDDNLIINPKQLTVSVCDYGGILSKTDAHRLGYWGVHQYYSDANVISAIPPLTWPDVSEKTNIFTAGALVGLLFNYLKPRPLSELTSEMRFLSIVMTTPRYNIYEENIPEIFRSSLIALINDMMSDSKQKRPNIDICIDRLTDIINNFCVKAPGQIKAQKSTDEVIHQYLNSFLPSGNNKPTYLSIISTLSTVCENWNNKTDKEKNRVASHIKNTVIYQLSNCEPNQRFSLAQQLRNHPIFSTHIAQGMAALGRTDRQIILDSYTPMQKK